MSRKHAQKISFAPIIASARSPAENQDFHGLKQNQEIQTHRNALDVKKVVTKFFDIVLYGSAISAMHLRPAGRSRPDRPAVAIERNFSDQFLFLFGHERSRPHEIYISTQDVVELWNLVKPGAPQPVADPRHPLI